MVESEGADLLSYSSGNRSSAGFLMRFLIQGLSAPAMVRVYRPFRAAFTNWAMAADDGIGIAPDKIPYLFDRYYRVDERGVQYSGLGLGLYICAEIVKKHGDQLGVESEAGKGSTFWFTLPLSDPSQRLPFFYW